jgi:hypothetical protein
MLDFNCTDICGNTAPGDHSVSSVWVSKKWLLWPRQLPTVIKQLRESVVVDKKDFHKLMFAILKWISSTRMPKGSCVSDWIRKLGWSSMTIIWTWLITIQSYSTIFLSSYSYTQTRYYLYAFEFGKILG